MYYLTQGDIPFLSFAYSLNIASSNCTLYDRWSIFCPVTCLNINIEFSTVDLSGHSEMLYFWLHLLNYYPQKIIPHVLNNYLLCAKETFGIIYYCICHYYILSFIVTKNATIITAFKLTGHAYCMHSKYSHVSSTSK